jgi:cytochrome c553
MRTIAMALLTAGCLVAGAAHADGNAALGKTKSAPCAACHGVDGKGIAPNFPVLAGQHASYLVHALEQYRSGERNNAVMGPQAANLSDADIADLAAYYASLEGLSTPER